MQVILTKEVENLGSIGDIVSVKNGYARNYLIPRSVAVTATRDNVKEIEHHKRVLAKKKENLLNEFKTLAKKIEALTVTLTKQVGQEDKIFGSVTTSEIEEALASQGVSISRKHIKLEDSVKTIGEYKAFVHLHAEVTATLKVKIEAAETVEA